ncbi:protein DOWNSTREAM OF FLC-like [Impatiens glandulifera]|uniref:protein DOWNSTREAM OF FLC-like n=1 Tax=Impatiens glandulifera TaxID=253017 RepID=UPI001FB0656F|nr:protein DOWNSTREAM OF FLC-like [Impatiens glandulifera]
MGGHTLLVLVLVSAALVVLSTAEEIGAVNSFKVIGRVYCDTCQCGYETNITTYITGAKVKLQCLDRINYRLKYEAEGETNENGEYVIYVKGDKGDDMCDVSLVSSSLDGCDKVDTGRDRSRVSLTGYNGLVDEIRHANAMGFMINEPLGSCTMVLKQYQDNADV